MGKCDAAPKANDERGDLANNADGIGRKGRGSKQGQEACDTPRLLIRSARLRSRTG